MAKNNLNGDNYLKSNEVVFLADNAATETKKGTATPRRRAQSAYPVSRASADGPKFTSTPVKVSNISKAVKVLPITYSVVPAITAATKSEAAGSSGTTSTALSSVIPLQRIAKQPANRTSTQILKRYSVEFHYERPAKAASTGPKREIAANGQMSSSMAAARRRSIPPGLTITPIVQSTTVAESSNVICKPAQVYNIPTPQTVAKNIETKDIDTPTRIAPKQMFSTETFFRCKTPAETKSDATFRRNIIKKSISPQEPQQQQQQKSTPPPPAPSRGRPKGSKNKVHEPVCLTISSDDEEGTDDLSEPIPTETSQILLRSSVPSASNVIFRNKAPVNRCLNKSPGEQFPKTKSMMMEVEEEDEEDVEEELVEEEEMEMEVEEEEEEEESPGEDMNSSIELFPNEVHAGPIAGKTLQIKCRSIRVGSYKIHPVDDNPHIIIHLSASGFRFQVPSTRSMREMVNIIVTAEDIQQVLGHFGRCLPILFIFNTTACGERLRKQLHMLPDDVMFFDPDGEDDRQKIITFLIDVITEDHRNFLRHLFPGDNVLKEVDQKLANEILVKSTPQHSQSPPLDGEVINNALLTNALSNVINNAVMTSTVVSNAVISNAVVVNAAVVNSVVPGTAIIRTSSNPAANFITPSTVTIVQTPAPVVIQTLPVKLTPATPAPVTKLLTYPPPPQTGGIAITTEDILCLDDGEFLNDAIIDFYLRYLMNEQLSENDRQRTHIFSSFFYPRLTQKSSVRLRSGEDASCQSSVKRHAQVRSWTKNIDIFEKDFIIIPINQNVHWFLAIICFPGLVPEGSYTTKSTCAGKSSDDVTSTNDGELEEMDSANLNSSSPLMSSMDETKEQGNIDDHNSDDASSTLSNEVNSSSTEEPIPEAPDSSTHPDKNMPHDKMPCILIFDSLSGPSRWRIVATLRDYLDMEWKIKKGTSRDFSKTAMRGHVPRVPQQTNFSDCGVYLLQYVESFFQNPFPYFSNIMPQLPDWFSPEKVTSKREEIRNLIMTIHKEQSSSNTNSSTNTRGTNSKKEIEKAVCSTTTTVPHVQNARAAS